MKRLPPLRPLTYAILKSANLRDVPTLETIFDDLEARLEKVDSKKNLEEWLGLYGQFKEATTDEWMAIDVDYFSYTDNEAYGNAYNHKVSEITPVNDSRSSKLLKKLRENAAFSELAEDYGVFRADVATTIDLFREENSPLKIRETNLGREYGEAVGALTVDFQGQKLTSQQIKPILEGTDRAARQEVWELEKNAKLAHSARFGEIFREQVDLRQQQAKNAGFTLKDDPETGDYLAYKYRMEREYSPKETLQLHQAIADYVVPFVRSFKKDRLDRMVASGQLRPGEKLQPFDLTTDPDGLPPLQPFADHKEFEKKLVELGHAVDPRIGRVMSEIIRNGYVDAEDRPGKTPCYGYCADFNLPGLSFICVNNAKTQEGIGTAIHEGFGHASHFYFRSQQPLAVNRAEPPMEACELASMSQELIVPHHLGVIYKDPSDLLRGQREMTEAFFNYLTMVAATDAFQHWVYAHPKSTPKEQDEIWLQQAERFGSGEDWSGYKDILIQDILIRDWQERAHLFNNPLYSQYLQAGVGALQIAAHYDKDPEGTITHYIEFMKAGKSLPVAQLFEKAGIQFDTRGETLPESMQAMEIKFAQLHAAELALAATPRRDLDGITRPSVPVPALELDRQKTV